MDPFQLSVFHDSRFYEMYMEWTKVAKKVHKEQLNTQYTDNKLTKEPCVFSRHVFKYPEHLNAFI